MPLQILQTELAGLACDAVVLPAGPEDGLETAGDARLSPTPDGAGRRVVRAAVPDWQGGGRGEGEALASCYRNALRAAREAGCGSAAAALLAEGAPGFPPELVLRAATDAVGAFLWAEEMQVLLVVSDRDRVRPDAGLAAFLRGQ